MLYVYLTNLTKIWNIIVVFLQSEKKSLEYPQRRDYVQPNFRIIFFLSSRKKERKKERKRKKKEKVPTTGQCSVPTLMPQWPILIQYLKVKGEVIHTRWRWVTSVTPRLNDAPSVKCLSTHWLEGWVGLRAGLDVLRREKCCPCRELNDSLVEFDI